MTWWQLQNLLGYWEEFPPLYILVNGIAAGMSGLKKVGRSAPEVVAPRIQSAQELLGILQGSEIPGGVIHGRR